MKKHKFICRVILLFSLVTGTYAQRLTSHVLVVKNTNNPISVAVANDYSKSTSMTLAPVFTLLLIRMELPW